jgi:hypothetical protein
MLESAAQPNAWHSCGLLRVYSEWLAEQRARLDDEAWNLQETGASAEYEPAFARPRAATHGSLAWSGESLAACRDSVFASLDAAGGGDQDIATLFKS